MCGQCGARLDHKAAANSWCAKCTYPPCTGCGCSRPAKTRYHVQVMPTWTCEDCSRKCCSKCGAPLANKAPANSLCANCKFPACTGCGCPRPQKSEYHFKLLPSWQCGACLNLPGGVPRKRRRSSQPEPNSSTVEPTTQPTTAANPGTATHEDRNQNPGAMPVGVPRKRPCTPKSTASSSPP